MRSPQEALLPTPFPVSEARQGVGSETWDERRLHGYRVLAASELGQGVLSRTVVGLLAP